MFRLIRLTLSLIVICAVAIFAAHLVGRTQPSPLPLAALFTNPDGTPCERPCLFGIRPGKMSVDEAVAVLKSHRLLNNVRRLDNPNYAFPIGAYSNDLFPGKQLLIYVEPGPGDQNPIMATGVELVLIEPDEDAMSHIDQPIVPLGTFIDFAGEPEATSLFPSHRFTIYFQQQSLQADIVSPLSAILSLENGRYKPNIDDMIFGIAVHKVPGFISFRGDKWCGFTSRYCGYIKKRQNVTP